MDRWPDSGVSFFFWGVADGLRCKVKRERANMVHGCTTTGEGYKPVGVALAEVDFRIGGLIRFRYSAQGTLVNRTPRGLEIDLDRRDAFRFRRQPHAPAGGQHGVAEPTVKLSAIQNRFKTQSARSGTEKRVE